MKSVYNPMRKLGLYVGSRFTVEILALLLLLMLPNSFLLLNQASFTSSSSPQTFKPIVDKGPEAASQIGGDSSKNISQLVSTRESTPSPNVHYSNGASHPSFYLLPKRDLIDTGLHGAATQPPYSHGGPIMNSPVVYLVFWRPTGYNFDTSDGSYFGLIRRYFTDVSGSNFFNILTQYYGSNGQTSNRVVLGGSYTYSGSFPNSEGSSKNPLLDSDIQSLVVNFTQYLGLNGGVDEEVFIFTPLNVYQCYDAYQTQCAYTQYGGYHSNFTNNGHELVYSYLPDLGTDCANWCTGYSPNNDQYADLMIDVVAHEQFESVSDPITGTGWLASSVQTEIGDLCAGNYGIINIDGSNIALNGDKYLIQQMWSNYDGGCSQNFSPTFAHISLNPATSSAALNISNFFHLAFPIGTDTLTIPYVGSPVNITINPYSTLMITGNSTGSSSAESWCLEESCHNISIQTSAGQVMTLNYYYFDLLSIQIYLNTFEPHAPSITLHYSAAPDSPTSTGALNLTSLTLSHLNSVFWAQRGSIASSSISATASGGWQFESWTGTGAASYSGIGQFSNQVNSAITEKATFYPGITVTASNYGSISYAYESTKGTISAGTTQTIYVPQGTRVTFTANPSSIIFTFTSWTGVNATSKAEASAIVNSPSTLMGAFGYNYPFIIGAVGTIAVIGGASTLILRRRGRPSPIPSPGHVSAPVLAPTQPLTKSCVSCNSTIPSADSRCPVCGFKQTQTQ